MPVQTYLPAEILDYVETHAPPSDSPFGISQRELARVLGYHPCSMSRPLSDLVEDGSLSRRRGQVRGGQRRQLVYTLTERGRERLQRATKDVPLLSGALPPPPNPFLGRKDELRSLWKFSGPQGGLVFVEGAPGMGKTALVSRHVRRVKTGRIPFWFTVRTGSSPRHFTLALAHALSPLGAQQLAYYSQLPRQPVGREVADLAGRALGDRLLAAVIDDVQVAGPDMRKFLSEFSLDLLRRRADLVFIVGQEPPFFEPSGFDSHHFLIEGLDRVAAHELTDRRGGLADRFESVYQASRGSPLLLQLAVTAPEVEATESTLSAAVIDRLPHTEIVALAAVGLSNEPLPLSFVGESPRLSATRQADLIRAGILQRALGGRVELLEVVKKALVSRLTAGEEATAHLELAGFYGRSHRAEAVRERFLHLVAAEAWRPAVQVITRQERTLLSLGYSDTLRATLRHLTAAIPRGPGKVRALRTEAALLRHHSEYAEAILCLRRAVDESEGDLRARAECLLGIAELYVRLRQIDEAENTLTQVRRQPELSRRARVFLEYIQARIEEARGSVVEAQRMYREAFEHARRNKATDLALESLAGWLHIASLEREQTIPAETIEEGIREARGSGRMDLLFNLLLVRARVYAISGQAELAEAELLAIRTEAEALGYLNQLTHTISGLVAMAVEGQRWDEATHYAKQAISLAERLGNDIVLGHTLGLMSAGKLRQGVLDGRPDCLTEAITYGERSAEVLNRMAPTDSLVLTYAYLAEASLNLKRMGDARRYYDHSLEVASGLGLRWLRDQIVSEVGSKMADAITVRAEIREP